MEFTEAESNLNDLISEYYGGWGCDDYDDDDYDWLVIISNINWL